MNYTDSSVGMESSSIPSKKKSIIYLVKILILIPIFYYALIALISWYTKSGSDGVNPLALILLIPLTPIVAFMVGRNPYHIYSKKEFFWYSLIAGIIGGGFAFFYFIPAFLLAAYLFMRIGNKLANR